MGAAYGPFLSLFVWAEDDAERAVGREDERNVSGW